MLGLLCVLFPAGVSVPATGEESTLLERSALSAFLTLLPWVCQALSEHCLPGSSCCPQIGHRNWEQ